MNEAMKLIRKELGNDAIILKFKSDTNEWFSWLF